MSEWKPIETAPNGKAVLIAYGIAGYAVAVAYQTDNEPPMVNSWRYAEGRCRGEQTPWPTHWMPLPPPPTIPAQEGEG